MHWSITKNLFSTILLCCLQANTVAPQILQTDLKTYLAQNQFELKITNHRLDGAAAKWLRDEAAVAQFLFIGEEHDTREVPLISSALWRDLVTLGYRHVAIEAGPWLGNRLDRFARFKDRAALDQFQAAALPRRPGLYVPPASIEDLAFFRVLAETPRPIRPIVWGLDAESKVAPLLERLIVLNPERSSHVRQLLGRVSEAEQRGEYDMLAFKPEFESLLKTTIAPANSETSYIVESLRWKALGKLDDQRREEMMKQIFLRHYRGAQSANAQKPRVMLRFGSDHGRRGVLLEYGTSTIGNFVGELASMEGTQMLTLIFIGCSLDSSDNLPEKSNSWRCSERERVWLKPFADAARYQWTLFDLRNLRKQLTSANLGWEFREIIAGYDAVVFMKNAQVAQFAK